MKRYCEICEREIINEMGNVCMPCLNAESIILYGKDINGNGRAITAQDKIKLLVSFNWNGPYL